MYVAVLLIFCILFLCCFQLSYKEMITTVWSIVQVYRNLFSWFISYITDTTFASLMTVISNLTLFFYFLSPSSSSLSKSVFHIWHDWDMIFFLFVSVIISKLWQIFVACSLRSQQNSPHLSSNHFYLLSVEWTMCNIEKAVYICI